MRHSTLCALVLAASTCGLLLFSCDSGNPVAPEAPQDPGNGGGGSGFTVTVTANPPELLAGGSEPSTLTVTARRQDNQQSPPDGTAATVSVDQGSLGVNNPANPVRLATVQLVNGQGQVSFFPGAQVATANVLVQVGQSLGRATVSILDALPSDFFITAVEPGVGSAVGGERVLVRGAGFKEPVRVTFGGVAGRVVGLESSAVIVVDTPPAAQAPAPGTSVAVDVTVTNELTAPTPATDTLPGGFFYTEDPDPVPEPVFVTAVQPRTGTAAGGDSVVVLGGGFRAPLRVELGGKAGQVISFTSTQISVVTPSSPQPVAAGATLAVAVKVVAALDENPPQEATLPGGFTFDGGAAPIPVVVSSLSPGEGPYTGGTVITVIGSGFVSPVAVTLGGVGQQSPTVVSSTQVQFTTAALAVAQCPAGGVVQVTGVTVTNLGSGSSGSGLLTFNYRVPLPRVRRISPTAGPQLGNTVVSIEGEGFESPSRVNFVKGDQQFSAVVQGTPTATLVRASSPRVPDTLFPEVDCVNHENLPGKRFVPVTVDIQVENQVTGCADSFGNAFTYNPTFANCRVVTPAPP